MAPKEKAEELVSRYRKEVLKGKYRIHGFVIEELAEECALIAVNEIINESSEKIHRQGRSLLSDKEYWLQVKQEIEKL